MDDNSRAILNVIARAERLTMRIGVVTAVVAPKNINCKIGGDILNAAGSVITAAPIITGVRRLTSYSPTIGDTVVLLVDESKQLFIAVGNI